MIFYFTATGNSRFLAETLAEHTGDTLVNIADCVREGHYSFAPAAGESIGFVVPVYFFGLPMMVVEFLQKLQLPAKQETYTYAVLNCGGTTGDAERFFRKLLPVTAVFGIVTVDNYAILYPVMRDAEINQRLAAAERGMAEIARQVQRKAAGRYNSCRGHLPGLLTAVAYPLYKHGRKTRNFSVSAACTSCGLCANICPRGVIRLEEGRPVWAAAQCELCLACLHRCPVAAINYGKKSAGNGRYVNPKVRL